jgi:hypothetical protein
VGVCHDALHVELDPARRFEGAVRALLGGGLQVERHAGAMRRGTAFRGWEGL